MNEPKEIWVLVMLMINLTSLFPDFYLKSYYLVQIYKTSKILRAFKNGRTNILERGLLFILNYKPQFGLILSV